jgi:hypothetical protein
LLVPTLVAAALMMSSAGADTHQLDRAYHSAARGRVVTLLPGDYGPQELTAGGRPVVFVAKGKVSLGKLTIQGATHVEFRGMTINDWAVESGDFITFRNVTTVGAFDIHAPSSHISILGGSVGPSHNDNSYISVPNPNVAQPSRNILIDGVRFHDVTHDDNSHVECLHLAQGVNVVIRNSTFTRCSVFDLFVTWWYFWPKVGPPRHVTLTHNVFDRTTDGYFSVEWASFVRKAGLPWRDFTVTRNRCGQQVDWGPVKRVRFSVAANVGC